MFEFLNNPDLLSFLGKGQGASGAFSVGQGGMSSGLGLGKQANAIGNMNVPNVPTNFLQGGGKEGGGFMSKIGGMLGGGGDAAGAASGAAGGADIVGNVMGFASSMAKPIQDMGKGTRDFMNERGVQTSEVDVLGNTLSTTMAGAKAGNSIVPGIGGVVGGAVGLVGGLTTSLIAKKDEPNQTDLLNQHDRYLMSGQTGLIRSNDTLPVQAKPAEQGMKDVQGKKLIEVERDEIILRKQGKAFKKVADFKGGKPHSMGGEAYVATDGDIIIPGKKRSAVDQALRLRDWNRIESIRQKLPPDREPAKYSDGVDDLNAKDVQSINQSSGIQFTPQGANQLFEKTNLGALNGWPELNMLGLEKIYDVSATPEGTYSIAPNKRNVRNAEAYKSDILRLSKANVGSRLGDLSTSNSYTQYPTRNPQKDINASINQGMYVDTDGLEEYKGGTSSINTNTTNATASVTTGASASINQGWTPELVQNFIDQNVIKGKEAPITGEELLALANKHNFPIELALIQGAQESNFGTKGAGTWTNNIFNWGNTTEGDKKTREQALKDGNRKVMDSVQAGVETYMKGVKRSYLDPLNGDWEALLEDKSFVNKDGNRYAQHKDYEKNLVKLKATLPDPAPKLTYEEYMDQNLTPELTPEEQAILDRENYLESLVQSEKAIINNATPTGKSVRDNLEKGMAEDIKWMNENITDAEELPQWMQIGIEDNDWDITKSVKDLWNKFPSKAKRGVAAFSADYGGDKSTRWGQDAQEQRFANTPEGKALKQDATAFHNFLQEQIPFLQRAGVEFTEAVDAFVMKPLFGKTIESSDMRIDADIAANFTQEEYDALVQQAKEQGIISNDFGEAYAYDLYKNPERYYSVADEGQLAFDMATILNPKGLFQLGKGAVKGTGAVAKGTYKVGKATVKGSYEAAKYLKNNYKTLAKKAPALAKKMMDKTIDFLGDTPMYKDGEGVFDAVNDIMKEGKTPRGARKVKWDNIKTKYERAKRFVADIPANMREAYYGRSLDDILKAEADVLEHTGKSWDEIRTMSKEQIGDLFKQAQKGKLDKYKAASKAEDAAWTTYREALEDLESLKAKPGLPPAQVEEAAKLLKQAQDDLLEASAETLRQKPGRPIALGSEKDMMEYANALKKTEVQVAESSLMKLDQLAEYEKLDDFQQGLVRMNTGKGGAWQKQLGGRIQQSDDGFLITKLNKEQKAKEAAQAAHKVTKDAEDALGKAKKFQEEFPDIANKLVKDEKLRAHFRRGTVRGMAALDALLRSGVPESKARAFIESDYAPEDLDTGSTDTTGTTEIDMTPIPRPDIGTTEGGSGLDVAIPEVPDNFLQKKKEEKSGFKIGGVLSDLAAYAPAIYNISKGLGRADKIDRRFIQPSTLQYEDVSDPQRNLIDTAFNAALSNARNTSGGLMSNYRANTEAAWADRIARRSQVDAGEVDRSMQIANQNVNIRNQAQQYNQQVNAQADQIDMQSEAATNAFLGQGIQDVANITAMRNRDKQAQSNQEFILKAMNSGRAFQIDPSGSLTFTGNTAVPRITPTPVSAAPKVNPFDDMEVPEFSITKPTNSFSF